VQVVWRVASHLAAELGEASQALRRAQHEALRFVVGAILLEGHEVHVLRVLP